MVWFICKVCIWLRYDIKRLVYRYTSFIWKSFWIPTLASRVYHFCNSHLWRICQRGLSLSFLRAWYWTCSHVVVEIEAINSGLHQWRSSVIGCTSELQVHCSVLAHCICSFYWRAILFYWRSCIQSAYFSSFRKLFISFLRANLCRMDPVTVWL